MCVWLRSEVNTIMAMYYYWLNLGPLTRGSSATGLAVLVGTALAMDLPVSGDGSVCVVRAVLYMLLLVP